MDEFSLDEHVKEINALYGHRRDLIIQCMEKEFTDGTTWTHPEGGLFLWLTFPEGVSARKVFDKCIEKCSWRPRGILLPDNKERPSYAHQLLQYA